MHPNLTDIQTDALMEMINIGMGQAARVLSEMVKAQVTLRVPWVRVVPPEQAHKELLSLDQGPAAAVILGYRGLLSGNSMLCFPPSSAATLTNFLTGEEGESLGLDAFKAATLTEVGNIMLNGVMGSISNLLGAHLKFLVPVYEEGLTHQLLSRHLSTGSEVVVIAETSLEVKALSITGDTVLLLEADSLSTILQAINKLVEGYREG